MKVSITKSLKTLATIHRYNSSIATALEDAVDFKQEGDMEMYNEMLKDVEKYKRRILQLWPLVSEQDKNKYQGKTVTYDDGNGEVKPSISIN